MSEGSKEHPGRELLRKDFMRLKECRNGPILYNINDKFLGRSLDIYGEFSEAEAQLFRQLIRPGMVVVDVGANIGCHTQVMALAVGATGVVVSFEPQRILFQTLCANIALAGHGNVRTYHAAVGATSGDIVVPAVRYDIEGNFGGVGLGDCGSGERAPVMTLDQLPFGDCHFIKIDVEGMERQVLEGADQVIRTHRPLLYVENDRHEKSEALLECLFALDYRLYWHHPPLFNPDNYFGNPENVFGNIVSRNMLCVPEESDLRVDAPKITDAKVRF